MCYPFFEEWQQRRVDNRRLRKMREHFAMGRRWDVTKGERIDECSEQFAQKRCQLEAPSVLCSCDSEAIAGL
jgi:hypothetical protein